jgi:drug/metabolite transporter (DMT)-like permease
MALAAALALQSAFLLAWLGLFDRPALTGSLREWRPSLGAGFIGAASSQFWFIGFALTAAANVRTLALVEIVLAQLVSRRLFTQRTSGQDIVGMA